ncbi:MAG TPA: single-stranded DNA-binding protein [Chloroflexia bacterium]|jgi:single-strand DNA-binding protein|nr:single-stranded DNA-binding protein [Chloroflexia bacterium]
MAGRGLNKVMIIGNLGKDPEMKFTPSGKAITTFSVAVGRMSRDPASGENREETEWFRIVAWDKLAETCNQYLHKGSKVYIEGRLQTRKYTDNNNQERTLVEVVANEMVMLDSRQAGQGPSEAPARGGQSYGGGQSFGGGGGDDLDDEIPF